jgi:hypothetical protein
MIAMPSTASIQGELFAERIGVVIPKVRAMAAVFVTREPTHRAADPDTSKRAGRKNPVRRGTDRALVLLAHAAAMPHGLTDHELAALLRRQINSVGKRRLELQRSTPAYIEATGMNRVSPAGSPATVYRITEDGVKMAKILSESPA